MYPTFIVSVIHVYISKYFLRNITFLPTNVVFSCLNKSHLLCAMNLRPLKRRKDELKRRKDEQMVNVFKRVPTDTWIEIFKCLCPTKHDFLHFYHYKIDKSVSYDMIDDIYNCRLVCKKWSVILTNTTLWKSVISKYNRQHLTKDLWKDLNESPSPSFFAQITMRGFKKEYATLDLLAKWFRKRRWKLLFQTLSPILTFSSMYLCKTDIEEYILNNVMTYHDISIHDEHVYEFRYNHYWGDNGCAVRRYNGDCFEVRKNKILNAEPSHIVFHCDERGNYLEMRTWMGGLDEGCDRFASFEIKPIYIWYGILCMQALWEGYYWFENRERVLKKWRKVMSIGPENVL